ncbi:MAG: radical SAM protein [Prevotella sp.]|nr:radical SAM protein [Prevotella sp.]
MEKSYRINEIFYSLQGEGRHTGRAAVFIRFSGCNLKCPFCDTDFDDYTEMTAMQIIESVKKWNRCGFIVLTGGEPSLQADELLVSALQQEGFYVAIETNGTRPLPCNINWVTISPKTPFINCAPALAKVRADEVKVVFDGIHDPAPYVTLYGEAYLSLQPCDTGDAERNSELTRQCIDYIKRNPHWHLSLQMHKMVNIK